MATTTGRSSGFPQSSREELLLLTNTWGVERLPGGSAEGRRNTKSAAPPFRGQSPKKGEGRPGASLTKLSLLLAGWTRNVALVTYLGNPEGGGSTTPAPFLASLLVLSAATKLNTRGAGAEEETELLLVSIIGTEEEVTGEFKSRETKGVLQEAFRLLLGILGGKE